MLPKFGQVLDVAVVGKCRCDIFGFQPVQLQFFNGVKEGINDAANPPLAGHIAGMESIPSGKVQLNRTSEPSESL